MLDGTVGDWASWEWQGYEAIHVSQQSQWQDEFIKISLSQQTIFKTVKLAYTFSDTIFLFYYFFAFNFFPNSTFWLLSSSLATLACSSPSPFSLFNKHKTERHTNTHKTTCKSHRSGNPNIQAKKQNKKRQIMPKRSTLRQEYLQNATSSFYVGHLLFVMGPTETPVEKLFLCWQLPIADWFMGIGVEPVPSPPLSSGTPSGLNQCGSYSCCHCLIKFILH